MSTTINEQLIAKGGLKALGTVSMPDNSISGTALNASVLVPANRLIHRFALVYAQADGGSVVTATVGIHVAASAGTVKSIEVGLTGAAAVGAATFTVDLNKSTGGGAFATMLSGNITVDSATAIRTVEAGTVSSGSYTDGDILQLEMVATAGGGTLPQGVVVTVIVEENPV